MHFSTSSRWRCGVEAPVSFNLPGCLHRCTATYRSHVSTLQLHQPCYVGQLASRIQFVFDLHGPQSSRGTFVQFGLLRDVIPNYIHLVLRRESVFKRKRAAFLSDVMQHSLLEPRSFYMYRAPAFQVGANRSC